MTSLTHDILLITFDDPSSDGNIPTKALLLSLHDEKTTLTIKPNLVFYSCAGGKE